MNAKDILMNLGDNLKNSNLKNSLNIYISLFDFFKTAKFKLITGENFLVSDGILQFKNYFIPLDAVSMVEMGRIQITSWPFLVILVVGYILYENSMLLQSIGGLLGAIGFVGWIIIVILNIILPYIMIIRLNNNIFCTYMSYKKSFIQEMMIKMQECINNRKGEYNFMLNQGKIEYNDNHSINIGGSVGGDFIAAGANKETHENNNNTTINHLQQNNTGLTIEDWMNLEKFFILRRQEFSSSDRNYKICNNLATYTQRKDAGKIKEYLQKIGKEGIRMLLNAGTNVVDAVAMETVKPILQKILNLNG